MLNRYRLSSFLVLMIVFAVFFVGCSQPTKEADQPKAKELSIAEVLTKANETMKPQKGVSFQVEGTQKIGSAGSVIQASFKTDVDLNYSDKTMYAKGQADSFGMSMPIEVYMADGVVYSNLLDEWMKLPGDESDVSDEIGEVPLEMIGKIEELIKSLGASKEPKGITMKKENGTYVITVDSAQLEGSKEFLDKMTKDQLGDLEDLQNLLMDPEELKEIEKDAAKDPAGTSTDDLTNFMLDFSKIKMEAYKSSLYINEKTFELTGYDEEIKMNVPMGKNNMVMEMGTKTKVKGPFENKIVVPEDVKKKAEEFEKEMEQGL